MDVSEALKRTRELLREKDLHRQLLDDEISQLSLEVLALEQAAERWDARIPPRDSPPRSLTWVRLGRTEAVYKVLEEEGALTNVQVFKALEQRGRSGDTPKLIGAALSYLKKMGRVDSPERGVWEVIPPPESIPISMVALTEEPMR